MPAPTIRGTGIQASSNNTYTVSFPSGTVAGDLALLCIGHAYGVNAAPSGWTPYQYLSGGNWTGAVYAKALNSSDISTGSVTIGFAGVYDGVLSIITIVGSANSNVVEVDAARSNFGASSVALSTATGYSSANFLQIYFGSNRAASTDTVSNGTLQQQANDLASASGCLYTEVGAAGILTRTFFYSVPGNGYYQAIALIGVMVETEPPLITPPFIARHQIVKEPAAIRLTPGLQTPVPVAQALKGGTVGTAYSETITAQGGTAPYTFSATGTVPTGTTLSSSGVISGTPTAAGTFNFSVTVVDAGLFTGVQPFTIVIASVAAPSNYGYTA